MCRMAATWAWRHAAPRSRIGDANAARLRRSAAALAGARQSNVDGDPYVAPGKFQFLRCQDLAQRMPPPMHATAAARALMDRANTGVGGTAVNVFVYGPDMTGVEAELRLLRRRRREELRRRHRQGAGRAGPMRPIPERMSGRSVAPACAMISPRARRRPSISFRAPAQQEHRLLAEQVPEPPRRVEPQRPAPGIERERALHLGADRSRTGRGNP